MRARKNKIIIGLGFLLSLRLKANGFLKYSIQNIYFSGFRQRKGDIKYSIQNIYCLRFQAKGRIKYSIQYIYSL